MTRQWRRYRAWAESLEHGDPQHAVADMVAWWLSGHGLLRRPVSGSSWWRDYEWQWRFWRGPYYHYAVNGDQEMREPPSGWSGLGRMSFMESLHATRGLWGVVRWAYLNGPVTPAVCERLPAQTFSEVHRLAVPMTEHEHQLARAKREGVQEGRQKERELHGARVDAVEARADHAYKAGYECGYQDGWNACIEYLLDEAETRHEPRGEEDGTD